MCKFKQAMFSVKVLFFILFFISINTLGQEICQEYSIGPGTHFSILNNFLGDTKEEIISVPDSYVITDVNITVNIEYNNTGDIDISLISPSGTEVVLSEDNGGALNITFDDASGSVLNDNSPLMGTYRPQGLLANFNNENSKGDWVLVVKNDTLLDTGIINEVILSLCYFHYPVGGHKGPGGIGHTDGVSSLVLWTKPDDIEEVDNASFANWVDASGYSSHLSQSNINFQPIIKKNVLNGYDVVRFGTGNRRLDKTGFTDFPTRAISGFYVNTTLDNDADSDAPFSYAIAGSNNDFRFLNSSKIRMYRNAYNEQPDWDLTDGNWYILGFRWEGVKGKPTISKNGDNAYGGPSDPNMATRELTKGTEIPGGGTFSLAGDKDSSGNYEASKSHQGDFSEVILFNTFITEAERIIVANYLSAKYDIALDSSVDFYDEDTNSNFDHDVAGIGQASDGSSHTDSQGTGIVRMHTPSDLDDDEFLFWGRNNKIAYTFETNTGNYKESISSIWRISKTNGVGLGTVTIEIDMTGIDLSNKQNCVPLQLVVSNDANLLTPTTTYTLVNTTGNIYEATGVSFNDGDYFTIEYVDKIVRDNLSTTYYNVGSTAAPDTTDDCLKFLVKSGATATLTADANVREVEVESGGALIINSGVVLTITDGIINSGAINVLGEGQVVQNHSGTSLNSGAGNFTITQQGTSNQYDYNYWSSSVNNRNVDDGDDFWKLKALEFGGVAVNFTSSVDADASNSPIKISTEWLYTFNGNSGNYYYWVKIDPLITSILPGEGFSMKGPGTGGAFTFKGEANDGEYILTTTIGNDYLVGNPYPSDLNADLFIADNIAAIDGTLYFWEQFGSANTHILNDYQGGYATYNALMGTSSTAGTGSVKGVPTGKIAVGQGFFVTTIGGDIAFKNSQRDVSSIAGNAVFYRNSNGKSSLEGKTAIDTRTKIWFSMADESGFKRIIGLGYDDKATEGYDSGYDAKLANFYPDNFYWILNDDQLVVQGLPRFSKTDVIDLGVEVVNSGMYTFSINKSENLPENTLVYLKDKETDTYYNLLGETSVAISLSAGVNYANRYAVTYFKQTNELHVESGELAQVTFSYSQIDQQLKINNYPSLNTISGLRIYSLSGQVILDLPWLETNTVQLPNISNAVYLIEIKDVVNGNVVKKFIKN